MSQIIASTYELGEMIGSGGGGIVYLGRHIRLDKPVVLKADKRTLAAKPEVLRREVDALKNLSHTYIPQVYDFVAEGDTVYTVMDYIEGESLDKPLGRGERFPLPQLIEWSCQLLEALCYLHSRPPHGILHSDIKPANIMRTPQGDICLIDFNIALALGEDGSIRVGYSRGYASPEHYGLDYTRTGARTFSSAVPGEDTTELLGPTESASAGQVRQTNSSRSGGDVPRKTVLLDVRSDIYSLGATLYHLFSGVRPNPDARKVAPIHMPGVSPAVAAIIQKAMAPDPDARYQTAQEMLADFEHLHDNDPRTRRHRRRVRMTSAILSAAFLLGGACTFAGLRQMERTQELARIAAEEAEAAQRIAKQALAAVTDSENAYRQGDLPQAAARALDALRLDSPYGAQAQRALTDALGVYDLAGGFKAHSLIQLPSEPLKAVLSPRGTRAAAMVLGMVLVFDTESGAPLAELAAEPSATADVVFLGEDTLLYAGEEGLTAYDLLQGRTLWSGGPATGIALSGGGEAVAAVYKDGSQAVIYDAATGKAQQVVSFDGRSQRVAENDIMIDPEDSLFALDSGGRHLAVSFSDGSLWCYDLWDPTGDFSVYTEGSDFSRFQGGFTGGYLAYAASSAEEHVFSVIDVAGISQVGGFSDSMPFYTQADERGLYLSVRNILEELDTETWEQLEVAYTASDITGFAVDGAYALAATADGGLSFYSRRAALAGQLEAARPDFVRLARDCALTARWDTPSLRILKLEDHPEAQLLSYDSGFLHSEARVSGDGSTIMLFRYDRFRLYDSGGNILAEVELPDAQSCYDQQYRRDGAESCLEVIYNSGLVRTYSARDGRLLSEVQGEKPDETLHEEFFTQRLRIVSDLHGTPAAYDRETGELVRELEADGYLTYVTELDGYLVTEYINAEQERYGLLLNEACETLAYLPGLCDVLEDGRLVFDDMSGNLRQSRIYSIQELIALATNN